MRSNCWFTAKRSPRPICCSLVMLESLGASLHRVKMLGLSHPSCSAHIEKMNRKSVSNDNSRSLSFKMSCTASSCPFSVSERAK